MSDEGARKRILDMLAAGHITVDAATDLLKAVGAQAPRPAGELPPAKARGSARILRISIDAPGNGEENAAKVRVNVPLALAKYASRFLPADASAELSMQGIDLAQLLKDLGDDVPDGRLVDVEADDGVGGRKTSIVVEIV
ncbi:MAG: hypothetical protein WC972_11580 [Trueperaceae bacterium]|jgi:hypothetical protein|nr:hypothetical protein [Truepera sp.]HRN18729.1 hypothetical protein [Trueperaceae bacterium]HRQ11466.1 hypothetical protein [Trueperaceae bacterium]